MILMGWILGSTEAKISAKNLNSLRWKETSSILILTVKSLLLNKLIKRKKIVAELSFSILLQRSSQSYPLFYLMSWREVIIWTNEIISHRKFSIWSNLHFISSFLSAFKISKDLFCELRVERLDLVLIGLILKINNLSDIANVIPRKRTPNTNLITTCQKR